MAMVEPTAVVDRLAIAVAGLESWLERMRSQSAGQAGYVGYGGPVVHWWRDSLLYCGPGFDWRYEGIMLGYLALYRRAHNPYWLKKAMRAGDDLLAAQLPNGNFPNSGFELNPTPAGTPHEAAVDVGLLALAAELRRAGVADADSSAYLDAAHRNIECFYVARLWDSQARVFRDDPTRPSFVPNKSATLVEALFRLADLTGDERWQVVYVRPTLDAIVRHQIRETGHALDGGIAQSSSGRVLVAKYFPYYIARCIPALLEGARRFGDGQYLEAALRAGVFLQRVRDPDGGFPQVVYPHGRFNRYPRWIAALGDILRAFELLRPCGLSIDVEPTRNLLVAGQLPSGAFKTAVGFSSKVSQRQPAGPGDMRDYLPVVGWNDKTFHYLASHAEPYFDEQPAAVTPTRVDCTFQGRAAVLRHDDRATELQQGNRVMIRWRHDAQWAETGVPLK
jgi:hypothetical protein